jgi:hypothetical protein
MLVPSVDREGGERDGRSGEERDAGRSGEAGSGSGHEDLLETGFELVDRRGSGGESRDSRRADTKLRLFSRPLA